MTAVLIDFATRQVVHPLPQPPTGPISHEVRARIRSAWHRGWAMTVAARYERDAARLRVGSCGLREPDRALLERRLHAANAAYDDARVALMATAAFEKAGVRWKWKQVEDLIGRQSEWEHVLAADEARFGISQARPKLEPKAPVADPIGPFGIRRSMLAGYIREAIEEVRNTPTH